MAWSRARSSGWAATCSVTAVPRPYQPGSVWRVCIQLNTQGIAPSWSIPPTAPPPPGRPPPRGPGADLEAGDLGNRGRLLEVGEEVGVVVDERPVVPAGGLGEVVEDVGPVRVGGRLPFGEAGEQDGVDELFEVPLGD